MQCFRLSIPSTREPFVRRFRLQSLPPASHPCSALGYSPFHPRTIRAALLTTAPSTHEPPVQRFRLQPLPPAAYQRLPTRRAGWPAGSTTDRWWWPGCAAGRPLGRWREGQPAAAAGALSDAQPAPAAAAASSRVLTSSSAWAGNLSDDGPGAEGERKNH